jgi:hypothetical protein
MRRKTVVRDYRRQAGDLWRLLSYRALNGEWRHVDSVIVSYPYCPEWWPV